MRLMGSGRTMATVFHRDEQTTTSRDVAVLAHYLGYPLVRVEVAPDKTETYTVKCPEMDFQIIVKEAASDETNVCYASIQKSNALVGAKIAYARKNGVWTSFTKPPAPQRTSQGRQQDRN